MNQEMPKLKIDDLALLKAISVLVDEVKTDGYGEVNFKVTVNAGKIVSMTLYKTASIKLGLYD